MATYEEKLVTNPFHLTLEEYKEVFPELKPRGTKILVVGLNPLSDLSGLILNDKNKQDKQESVRQSLMEKGFMVIGVGDAKICEDIKEGDFIICPDRQAVDYAIKRQIVSKDVFPRVREYTLMLLESHGCSAFIKPKNEITSEKRSVNVTKEEEAYKEYLEKVNSKLDESL